MPRENFEVSIPSSCTVYPADISYEVPDGRFATEWVEGVRRRKPDGSWLPPTSYTFLRTRYDRGHGQRLAQLSIAGSEFENRNEIVGCVDGAPGNNILNTFNAAYLMQEIDPSMVDRALTKALLNFKDSKVNLGVAFAEMNKTARLVGDVANRIARSIRYFRRDQYKKAFEAIGLRNKRGTPRGSQVTNQWLELQYGWNPLLNDVKGAAEALAQREFRDWNISGKGSVRQNIEVRSKDLQYGLTGGIVDVTGWEGVFVRVDAVPDRSPARDFAQLGLTNPLEIIWELVPYSFVVDWMLPVGDYLSCLDAGVGVNSSYTSITTFQKAKWHSRARSYDVINGPFHTRYLLKAESSMEQVRLRRLVSTGITLPSRPRLKDPRSFGHMANGLSLLASLFGRNTGPAIPRGARI